LSFKKSCVVTGATESKIKTLTIFLEIFPEKSVAVKFTIVSPKGNPFEGASLESNGFASTRSDTVIWLKST